MKEEELRKKYERIPQEIKDLKRWVCYTILNDKETGENRKIPINPLNGKPASSSNPLTWTNYNLALSGCEIFDLVGIGFILGTDNNTDTTYFGVDIDNHIDKITGKKSLSDDEFDEISSEFINALDSYTEYSHSGEGVHIICKGKLPVGARRRANCSIEMYDTGRFFTMTGNCINPVGIQERTNEIKPLWEKYLNVEKENNNNLYNNNFNKIAVNEVIKNGQLVITDSEEETTVSITTDIKMNDQELINRIKSSKNGFDFIQLYNGNMEKYGNDHSCADAALCQILAFWTGCNIQQMDRIFRQSALMREKWDSRRGSTTYGQMTLESAVCRTTNIYQPREEKPIVVPKIVEKYEITENENNETFPIENIDSKGNVIVKIKPEFLLQYDLTDTGNAERFYDYFGDLFKYNGDNKDFMFWDGRTWKPDNKECIRKYADEVYKIMVEEFETQKAQLKKEANEISDEEKRSNFVKSGMVDIIAKEKNALRVSNKSGKDGMINELKHLHDIPAVNSDFDQNPFLLNTLSGVVDLKTGELLPFDKKYMLSKNTNCEVSFEEPVIWNKFLHEIFERGNEQETEELVNCIQKAVGYSLTSSTKEQCMFLMYGATGSNGKSTFIEQIQKILGEYAITTPVQTLMGKKGNQTTEMLFSLSKLRSARFVSTGETNDGERLAESTIKLLTGSDTIQARQLYGKEFDFKPSFKIWMSTNNKPIIRGQEYAIWRRLFFFPFEKTFDENSKDIELPNKLAQETPQILGWAIKGFLKYQKEGLKKPKCVEIALTEYKDEMNVINSYLKEQCQDFPGFLTKASVLFQDFLNWTKRNNERSNLTQTKFGLELAKKGYMKKNKSDGIYYTGIKLIEDSKGRTFSEEDDE